MGTVASSVMVDPDTGGWDGPLPTPALDKMIEVLAGSNEIVSVCTTPITKTEMKRFGPYVVPEVSTSRLVLTVVYREP
jgi:hypothetical protein